LIAPPRSIYAGDGHRRPGLGGGKRGALLESFFDQVFVVKPFAGINALGRRRVGSRFARGRSRVELAAASG
jgi:hypothetical protein